MAVTIEELIEGTAFSKESREYAYAVHGTEDLDAALDEFPAPGATDYFTVDGRSVRFEAEDAKAEPLGKDCVKVTQTWHKYKRTNSEGSGETFSDLEIAFEFGVESQKIIHALYQEKGTDNTDNHFGLIGATADGIDGIDVPFPTVTFTIVKTFTPAEIDDDYLGDIYDLTTKVNDAAWFIFKAGEVRFDGATTSQQYNSETDEMDWRITFKFSARPEEDLTDRGIYVTNAGESLQVTKTKKGWDYLEIMAEPKAASGSSATIREPVIAGAWLDRVYKSGDFSALNLGGVSV